MNKNRIDSNVLKKGDVIHYRLLKRVVHHSISTILDYDGLSSQLLYIRKSFNKNRCPINLVLHNIVNRWRFVVVCHSKSSYFLDVSIAKRITYTPRTKLRNPVPSSKPNIMLKDCIA